MANYEYSIWLVWFNDLSNNKERKMTKKKTPASKKVVKKVSAPKKAKTKSSKVVKEVTTTETREADGSWSQTTVVKYVRKLLCPAFLTDPLILSLAAIPLVLLILAVLWRMTSHE